MCVCGAQWGRGGGGQSRETTTESRLDPPLVQCCGPADAGVRQSGLSVVLLGASCVREQGLAPGHVDVRMAFGSRHWCGNATGKLATSLNGFGACGGGGGGFSRCCLMPSNRSQLRQNSGPDVRRVPGVPHSSDRVHGRTRSQHIQIIVPPIPALSPGAA